MKHDKILPKIKSYYEQAKSSSAYQRWLAEQKEAWAFYDGEQWTKEEVDRLNENGQPAIVINKLASKIDNIAGSEISGRTRIFYRSRSGEKREEGTARALSDLALYVAEQNEQGLEISNVFKEGLVAGISWLDVGVESAFEGPHIFNRYEEASNVVWDQNFKRADYSDARFICRERWLDSENLKAMFPKTYENLGHRHSVSKPVSNGTLFEKPTFEISYQSEENETVLVIEVQFKQTEKSYKITTPKGKVFQTFDKKVAYANTENKVEESYEPRIYLGYFSDQVLLEFRALPYNFNNFTLIPYIYKRDKKDGRPYGLLRGAIDPQRELNKRRSKAMHLLNTAQVIADIDAVEDPNILAREAARPDGIILKRPGKDLRIVRNSDLASTQVAVMDQASRDIQEVIGLFDESIGKHSNATSGIAIHQRQRASAINQMFAFDALRRTKKLLGRMVLSMIRQFFSHQMVIQITDQLGASNAVQLNVPVVDENGNVLINDNGDPVKHNDVSLGVFDIMVEEVRDISSSRELEAEQLNLLMQSGVPIHPKFLVEATNLKNKDDILRSLEDVSSLTMEQKERELS
jgi:hypothetical protein